MLFKDDRVRSEYENSIPAELQTMVQWFNDLSIAHFQKEPVVTRVLENICGDSGVHEAHRGVDIRDEHAGSFVYTLGETAFLVSEMNRRFPRNDNKLSCIHHSFKGGARHFHLQIRPSNGTADLGPNIDDSNPPPSAV